MILRLQRLLGLFSGRSGMSLLLHAFALYGLVVVLACIGFDSRPVHHHIPLERSILCNNYLAGISLITRSIFLR